ncbi:MAG TPA: type II toxin-antitoxin system RelE/ParE family toxin [Vicinamibacterales bacterium]
MKLRLSTAAKRERLEATRFYQDRSPSAATRFNDELRQTLERLTTYPQSGAVVDGELRHARLHGFPFSVVYAIGEDSIDVIAVAHDSRDPNYWRDRTR